MDVVTIILFMLALITITESQFTHYVDWTPEGVSEYNLE